MAKGRQPSKNNQSKKVGVAFILFGCALLTNLLYRYAGSVAERESEGSSPKSKAPAPTGVDGTEMVQATEKALRADHDARTGVFAKGVGKVSSACRYAKSPYRLAVTGQQCIFPFQLGGTWRTTCDLGVCAVRIDALSRAVQLANCSSYTYGPLVCSHVSSVSHCKKKGVVSRVGCDHMLGGKTLAGTCKCIGPQGEVIAKQIGCDTARVASCAEICATIEDNMMSAAHSATKLSEEPDIIGKLSELAAASRPSPTELTMWKRFADALPDLHNHTAQWCGKGIAIMAGSVNTLPQALATVAFLRGQFRSLVPVEIWQTKDEETVFSPDFQRALTQLAVHIRTIPEEAKSEKTSEMFALKPAVVLGSSFDTVLLLDADSLPLVDPADLFAMRTPNVSAIFWPDYWTLLWDAHIWDAVGGWPFGSQHNVASQDSGLMVVCKSCGGWKALALAFYFNYHSDVYYYAIYNGHWHEKMCRGGHCVLGHDVPGAGDKDTFQIAWLAFKEPYTMMIPSSLGGTMLPKRNIVCGSSFIHRNHRMEGIALHHNSNKWWWRDFISGRWTHWHTGLLLTHTTTFLNSSAAYFADGMNDWRSVTYSTRYDAGRMPPPPGARWCIVYRGQIKTMKMLDDLGWDIERVLVGYYTKLYSAPWLVEWATLASGGSGLVSCVKQAKWREENWLTSASDEDVRNTAIARMNDLGLGSIPYLQSYSDVSLIKLCHQAASMTPVPRSGEEHSEE